MTYFTFSRALHLMKYSGAKVRRAGWSNKYYVIFIEDNEIKAEVRDAECTCDVLENEDILANDWEVYDA